MRTLVEVTPLLLALTACRERETTQIVDPLALRYLPGCAPARVERLSIEPLGDFSLGEGSLRALDVAPLSVSSLRQLPAAAQWYRITLTDERYQGAALVAVGAQPLEALLLPMQRVCAALDETLGTRNEALAVLPSGDLLLAGGIGNDGVSARNEVSLLHVAGRSLERRQAALFVPRAQASAVRGKDETWVLGGATSLRDGTAALDTFERYSHAQHSFVGLGRLASARVDASAVALSDGSVLLVGGRSEVGGAALGSIERVAADGASSEPYPEALPFAAVHPTLALRDDGQLLVLARNEEQLSLALIELASEAIVTLPAPPRAAEAHLEPTLSVALPGARVALFELSADGATTGRLILLMSDDGYLVLDDWLSSFAGIREPRSLALPDGRIVLTGLRQEQPVLRILDPGNRDVASRELDLLPHALFLRDDGSVLLAGRDGARLLREDARSAFDNPPGTLLAEDSAALCLDAYGRFEREGLSLRAQVANARFDLARLRYRAFEAQLTVRGEGELLLRRKDGAERTIALGGARIGPTFCELDSAPEKTITITRDEERITLRNDSGSRSCVLDGLTGPIAIAFRALEPNVRFSDLRITRN